MMAKLSPIRPFVRLRTEEGTTDVEQSKAASTAKTMEILRQSRWSLSQTIQLRTLKVFSLLMEANHMIFYYIHSVANVKSMYVHPPTFTDNQDPVT